jgi:hypothetical protein
MLALYYPYAYSLHTTGVYITGVLYSHLSICCMQAAGVLMVESCFAADKYLPQRPFVLIA